MNGATFQGNKAGVTGGALRVQVHTRLRTPCCLAAPLAARAPPAPVELRAASHRVRPLCAPACPALQGNLLCSGCTFEGNTAPLGGAVSLGKDTWAAFAAYSFSKNVGARAGRECFWGGLRSGCLRGC